MEFLAARPCTGNSYVVYPARMFDLPLKECCRVLKAGGYRVTDLKTMVDASSGRETFTLYRTGRLLISPCSEKEAAIRQAGELFGVLERDAKLGHLLREDGVRL